jgi:hypothetical protein
LFLGGWTLFQSLLFQLDEVERTVGQMRRELCGLAQRAEANGGTGSAEATDPLILEKTGFQFGDDCGFGFL